MQLVDSFGDYGWKSDDTRNTSGTNLVGINSTHAGKPGQTPTAADDTAIASQIQFVAGPNGSTYGGAVSIDGTSSNSGKSSISVIDTSSGFGTGASLLTSAFSAQYEWYGQPNLTTRSLAFKIGIQSKSWASSQASFTATRSGESVWDLVLVHVPASSDNMWSTVSLDHDSGTWALYRQAGNSYFTAPIASPQTLDAWASDPNYGDLLFDSSAKITSVQFGLGSSQRNSISYLDYVQTNLLNGGDVIDFKAAGTAAVPEASSILVWSLLALAVSGATWFRRQKVLA
ncbi:MAG: hypothetical protein IT427_00050 [Pirellulales bacterium]|nr:hypothetical protein [Pirellulales bacterium]